MGGYMDYALYQKISKVTLGKQPADLVLKNLKLVDVFTGEIVESNVAVKDGLIAGVSRRYRGKKEIDLGGKYLAPGFIDAHLHLESTMVTPNELVSTAARFGTTTFIVDPHEAANVSGAAGIDYILDQTEKSPANVYVMMPSCVPATHVDDNGGIFSANDMYPYVRNPRVLGLGEVMDDPGVINGDESMFSKLLLFENRTIDGHAPYLPNRELSAYKMAGVDTDHEATSFEYALEEVRRGIHVHIREGSAAHNLKDIVEGIVRTGIFFLLYGRQAYRGYFTGRPYQLQRKACGFPRHESGSGDQNGDDQHCKMLRLKASGRDFPGLPGGLCCAG